MKFFDRLLSLRDQYFSREVSLRTKEGMKLASEVMQFKAGEMYIELDGQYRDVVGRVMMFENQMGCWNQTMKHVFEKITCFVLSLHPNLLES